MRKHFPSHSLLDYALAVEKVTTSKKDTLILNVDGCIAVCFVDLLRDPPYLANIGQGLLVDLGYAVVFWLLAWARFAGKDITN